MLAWQVPYSLSHSPVHKPKILTNVPITDKTHWAVLGLPPECSPDEVYVISACSFPRQPLLHNSLPSTLEGLMAFCHCRTFCHRRTVKQSGSSRFLGKGATLAACHQFLSIFCSSQSSGYILLAGKTKPK